MNKTTGILAGLLLAAASLPVVAERGQHSPRDPGVNQRQQHQDQRIEQGARSGQLTPEETRRLAGEQRGIRQEERAYKSDGVLTKDERKDLQQDLNRSSRHIYQEKHDAERRPGTPPPHRRAPGDRDNNPPGPVGGPGTNWENPPGPVGGPGASPDRRLPPPGNPATRDPGVNARQHNQRDRIQQGVRSGELTKDEVKELATEQKAIRQEERAYKSDGVLTKDERKDLHQDLNQANKNIYEEKHDSEKR